MRQASSLLDAIWTPTSRLANIVLDSLPNYAGEIDVVYHRGVVTTATPEDRLSVRSPEELSGRLSSLGAERIRRAGDAIKSMADISETDVGFRFLRLDTTSMSEVLRYPDDSDQAQLDLDVNSVKVDRTGEDLLLQVLIDGGLELSLPIATEQHEGQEVFVVDDDALIACFDKDVSLDLVRVIASREPLRAVFRDSGIASDAARINAEQIFREISPATDCDEIAAFVVSSLQGANLLAKAQRSPVPVERFKEVLFASVLRRIG